MKRCSTSQGIGNRAEVKIVGGAVIEPKGYCIKKIINTQISSEVFRKLEGIM